MIMSTGMATLAEIDEAVQAARRGGATRNRLAEVQQCLPGSPAEMNLSTIPHLSAAFGVPVGLSDHTLGLAVPVTAVALGACIIEKHLALSRKLPGPDVAFSLEPDEFREMVAAVRTAQQAVGTVDYGVSPRRSGQPRIPPLAVCHQGHSRPASCSRATTSAASARPAGCRRSTWTRCWDARQRATSRPARR